MYSLEAKQKAADRYQRNKEVRRAYRQSARAKELERISRNRPERKAYLKEYRNTEKAKRGNMDWRLRKVFGITANEYDALCGSQGGVCAICLKPQPNGVRLAVDHCHTTNAVRGLLCTLCNRAVGLLKDNSANAERTVQYLRKYGF